MTQEEVKNLSDTSKQAYDENATKLICGEELFIKMLIAMSVDTETLDLNGYAIAIGRLKHCRCMHPDDEGKAFVRYQPDLYSHIYENIQRIKPFKWQGTQGWKKVDQSIYKIEIKN